MPNVDYRQFVDRFQSIERRLRNIELRPNPQLAVATGKTLTVDHSMTLTGADGFTLTIPETGTAVLVAATQTLTNKTLTTPTIGDFSNAQHSHADAAGGGQLSLTAAVSGILPPANGGTGVNNDTRTLTINTNSGTLAFSGAGFTLTIPKTGTVPVGTGTAGRIAEWVTDANTVQASTLEKTGAGVLTLSASGNFTLTIPATGTAALLGTAQTFTSVNTFDDDIISNSAIAVGLSSPLMPLHLQIDGSGGASVAAFDFDDGSISRISELRTGSLGSSLGWDVNNFFSFGTIAAHNQSGLTSTFMRIDTDGKVGIGTTSPSELLDLNKSTSYQLRLTNLGTGGGYWNIGQTSNGFAAGGGKLLFVPDSTSSNAATVTFTNTGNVGIGTVSPSYKLEVNGTFKANTTTPVFGAHTLTIPATGTAALLGTANAFTANQTVSGQMSINRNGNQIALNSGSGVAFAALEGILDDTTGGAFVFKPKSTTGLFTDRMRLLANGNVLIGTTTDSGGKLQVNQASSTGATPTLRLRQADLSEEFIRFDATVGAGNPINTTALGAYYGRVRVWVEGVGAKWLALYD